jgi:hypothetical protein
MNTALDLYLIIIIYVEVDFLRENNKKNQDNRNYLGEALLSLIDFVEIGAPLEGPVGNVLQFE